MPAERHPQPCLTRIEGVTCKGTLLPITAREWRCTEGHTMWGTARVMRSVPWPADRPHRPWFARVRAHFFGRANTPDSGSYLEDDL